MSDLVKKYLSAIGRRGGEAGRGAAKARTSEQCRAAALARWAKNKKKRPKEPKK